MGIKTTENVRQLRQNNFPKLAKLAPCPGIDVHKLDTRLIAVLFVHLEPFYLHC